MKIMIYLNKFDPSSLNTALDLKAANQEVGAILTQDAVYMVATNTETVANLNRAIQQGVKIYALSKDIRNRGIHQKLPDGVEEINYDELVDLLAEENQKIINL